MKLSARNLLKGKIKKIAIGAVNAEVELELPDKQVMIKASSVMIATD